MTRLAKSTEELELLLTVAAFHLAHYFDDKPLRRCLKRMGWPFANTSAECMRKAQRELTAVDYNYQRWFVKYHKPLISMENK